jgi:lambda repressor-like predicted transcriptional regulator
MSKDEARLLEFWRKRAAKIENALLNKSWTRAHLATKSGHDVRTIRTVLAGLEPVRDQTIVDVCQALGIDPELSEPTDPEIQVAEPWYGSYARDPYRSYEGVYFAYRRSFTYPDVFVRSVYEIKWHEDDWIFVFQEHQSYLANNKRKIDHSQAGEVYISQYTDLIHLVTVATGAVRTVTLRKMRDGIMRGCLLTQSDRETYFQPCVSGIFLEKALGFDPASIHDGMVGPIRSDHPDYERISEEMGTVERAVLFVAAPHRPSTQ